MLEATRSCSAPADRRIRAHSGLTPSPSNGATAADPAPQSVGKEPLWLAAAREDESIVGRKRKGAQTGSKGKKQGAAVLSDKVRGFPSPSAWIYRSGGATLPKLRAVSINCRRPHLSLTSGSQHVEMAGRACMRDYYDVETEEPRRPVTSAPPRRPLRVGQPHLKRRAHGA
jgi:hypothetical protein